MTEYFKGVWAARHFWLHLALADLRARWRRSFIGIFWSLLQPLGMTLLLAFVFSRLFKTDITLYAPYILSGIVVWDFIVTSTIGGASSFVMADAYIKQCRHPLAIYTLRTVTAAMIVLLFASAPLFAWAAIVMPQNVGLCWLAAFAIYPLIAILIWPLATLLAYLGARFRDVPHALTLVLQAVWFVSPVYFEAKLFRGGGMDALVDFNPVYHLLQIIRAPLLSGMWPAPENYAFVIASAGILALLAIAVGARAERRVIFYI